MAGDPHPVLAHDSKFRGYLSPSAWTLCLGAGISKGIAPEWSELARVVVAESFDVDLDDEAFDELVETSGWTLDSWIQAAANEYLLKGKSADSFNDLIESCLYSKIRSKAKGLGIEKHLTKVLNSPKREPKDRVIEVCDLIETEFPASSLVQTAGFLLAAARAGRAPKAVLTFNADTFLETYLDLRLRRDHYRGPGPHGHPEYPYVQVMRPSSNVGNKIPIIHCHGCVTPEWKSGSSPRDSRDRLVFLEQEYLAIANSGGSWAETVFQFHAQSSRMVFSGLSMSDANIRRWMGVSKIECSKDRKIFGYTERPNPDHIWMKPKPKDARFERLFLSSLHHLGVRPAWIRSWEGLEDGLGNLCAI
ncbi:hypothetical protein KBTX_02917 [wastewater metagenome]|uniref:Uncharacterized protein n=2 Tax=unclassified sequences TaxID=12908 RepID=A0A5B8RIL4_9ZZZZ|nr:SIR2 family protein [Arhodomonas sp. KWT]QEA06577.1 hypothetical protein KBTEX_02917 [uncultured organism]